MNNNTVASNHQPTTVSGSLGAGVHAATAGSASASGCNNIIYFNQANADPEVHGNVSFTYSCLSTSMSGVGNNTASPQFVNQQYYQYGLQATSPCIDTGNPSSSLDPDSTRADMGALYFPQSQPPILNVSPSSLSFYAESGGTNPPNQTFTISNTGAGTFSYVVTESITWLTVTPMTGGPIPPVATETLSVNISGLSAGTYQGDIIVTAAGASGSPTTVHVTLEIAQTPILSVSPLILSFNGEVGGNNPANQTFNISNSGGNTFSYTVSETASWLSVAPTSGGPVPPTATEAVSLNISGLAAGTHEADIVVTAASAQGSPDTVHVILSLTQHPILSITPDSLAFDAEVGGNNPANQIFQIFNDGTGTFNYSITEGMAWLAVTPTNGGPVPPTVAETVSVSIPGLSAGTYQGDITVTAPGVQGSPQTVHVTLTITQHPVLTVSTRNLTFAAEVGGSNPVSQTFQISNMGSGTFFYTVSEGISWLSVTPSVGGPVPPAVTATVSVTSSGLTAGTYGGNITVSAPGAQYSPITVHATLEITQHPILSVSQSSMTFYAALGGGNPPDQTFQVSNAGTGTLSYSVSESSVWLSVSPSSGSAPPAATELVSVDAGDLEAGSYSGDIIISAAGIPGSPDTVHVTLILTQDPILSLVPDHLEFAAEVGGNDPPNQSFQILNTGTGTYTYGISEIVPWLTVSPAGGGQVPPSASKTVSVDISELAAGSYQGDIIVTAAGAQGSPGTVHVSLTVTQHPVLSLSTDSLEFAAELGEGDPVGQTFQVSNAGNGTFDYAISENADWLSVSPSSGGPVPPEALETVSVDISGLSAGVYQDDIVVIAVGVGGSPDTIRVTLIVTQNPILSVSPDSLVFFGVMGGGDPSQQAFQINNIGTGIFDYTISESVTWLTVSPMTGGPVPPDVTEIVSADIAGLPAGTYQGEILITANGASNSPATVHVSLTITVDPILTVWPEELHFEGEVGSHPNVQTFTIFNLGTGTFSYAIDESILWLTVTPMHGEPVPPEATDTVAVDLSGLAAGTYEGDIFVTAPGAQNSPDTVHVTLTVTQNPALILSRITMTFEALAEGENPPHQTFLIDNVGTGTFDYSIFEDTAWLTVSPMSGGPVPPIATETVSVDIAELPAGTYQGDIIVTAAGAQGSPDTVHVVLNIDSAPVLLVEPITLVFNATEGGPDPLPQIVTISNGGGGSLDFRILCDVLWLEVRNDSGGPVPPSVDDTVSVVNISGFSSGSYEYVLTVEAEGALQSPQEVHVLLEINANGLRRIGAIELPREFALDPPYPNPFNPVTNVTISLPVPGNVVLTVYDVRGRKVGDLIRGWVPAGTYQATFDASGLSSGVYFCRMVAPAYNSVRKMTLIK